MRTLAVLLLFTATALGQETRILEFRDGCIAWTNSMTNVHFGVLFTDCLGNPWHPLPYTDADLQPPCWNNTVTNYLMSLPFDLQDFSASPFHRFFRIVASTNDLVSPTVTNLINFVNQSTAPVTNIVLNLETDSEPPLQTVSVTNLLSGTNTQYFVFALEEPTGAVASWGWFHGEYFQQGQKKDMSFFFHRFGPPPPPRSVKIQNDTYVVEE